MHAAMQAVPLNRPDVPIQTGSGRWGSLALPLSLFWCNPETWRVLLLHRHTADLPPTKSQSVKKFNQLQVNIFWKTNILHFTCCWAEHHHRFEWSQWGEGGKKNIPGQLGVTRFILLGYAWMSLWSMFIQPLRFMITGVLALLWRRLKLRDISQEWPPLDSHITK